MTETPSTGTAAPGAPQQLAHFGQGSELFSIFVVNQTLRMVTLGVYHFWAKTRVRRYLWSRTAFGGDRFEYTGRGSDLLRGFMLAVLLLAPLVGVYAYLQAAFGEVFLVKAADLFLVAPGLVFLTGFATFAARRYLLSRTRLRGVRFGLSGTARRHGLLMLGHTLLSLVTLGLYTPFMRTRLMANLVGNTWFGSQRASFSGDGWGLFRRFLLAWGMGVVLVAVAGGVVFAALMASGGQPGSWTVLGALLFPLIVVPGAAAIAVWYRGEELRYFAEHCSLGPLRMTATYSIGTFLRFSVANFLLLVFTLGMAFPFVVVRVIRFAAAHLRFSGELDFAAVAQSTQEMPKTGEGLAELFDLGAV